MLFLLGKFNPLTFQSFLDLPVQVLVICRMDFHEVGYFHQGTVTHGETCKKRMKHLKHGETCDLWEESVRVARSVLCKIIASSSHNLPWLFSSVHYLSILFSYEINFSSFERRDRFLWRSIFAELIFARTEIFADNIFFTYCKDLLSLMLNFRVGQFLWFPGLQCLCVVRK